MNPLGRNAEYCSSRWYISDHKRASPDHRTVPDTQAGQDGSVAACEDPLTQTYVPGNVGMTAQSAPVTHPNVVTYRCGDIECDESTQSYVRGQYYSRTQDTAHPDVAICPHND